LAAIAQIRDATSREVTAAGGISTLEEIEHLDRIGVDAVVGMALYTGRLPWPDPPRPPIG
jgi:phosphoribosylformimino-5-aminoimidazole carboxamide ribonucleotide (ProFAR) isomerase